MYEIEEKLKLQQQILQIENQTKLYLDKQALSRYGNIKAANPEKALQITIMLHKAIQSGQINQKLTDSQFKEILIQIQNTKKDFKFKRK